jgi:hypothetical protein
MIHYMEHLGKGSIVKMVYKNWKGVLGIRHVRVDCFFFGSNEWHTERQVLMRGTDLDKQAERVFAVKDIQQLLKVGSEEITKC